MRKTPLVGALLVLVIVALAAVAVSLQKPPTSHNTTSSTSNTTSSSITLTTSLVRVYGKPIIIGVEYAQPGMATAFAQLGISGVKYLPASFTWDKMQSSNSSAINFVPMDTFVKEYQDAGFTQLVIGLKSQSKWASVDFNINPTPKPEYQGAFQKWVSSIVERYDKDGVNDMPGLRFPVRYYEVGVEFSSYEPEPVGDYINMLSLAYKAAHGAYGNVIVLNSAFLVTTAFDSNPMPDQYLASFAKVDSRIMYHSLADIHEILDRPDIFDAVDFHALGDAYEIYSTVNWLNYEMGQRGYTKPIVIGDTVPSPLASWGPATVCNLAPSQMAILIQPAKETDRCRLAAFFKQLVAGNQTDLAWTEAFVASDMVEKVVIAAETNVTLIDTSFMEDLPLLTLPLLQASAGLSAWGGMAEASINALTQVRTIQGLRPSFYALKQLVAHMVNYTSVSRVSMNDSSVYVYKFVENGRPLWVAWYQPAGLALSGDPVPSKTVQLAVGGLRVDVESMVSGPDQTQPNVSAGMVVGGILTLVLGQTPVFVYPSG